MKKLAVILPLCALTGGMLLAGCSKPKNAAASTSGASGNPVVMKIQWTVGKKYSLHMDMDQTTKTDVPNLPQPGVQEVKLAQDFDYSVLKQLDNGGWQLQFEFETETMDVLQNGRKVMSFDSTQSPAQDTNNPAAPILRAIIGAQLQYFTDANGRVEKIEGVEDLMNRVATTASPQQQAMFRQMFNEDTLKQYGSFADAMPDHPVNIGDSWQLKKDVSSAIGILTLDMEYTFENWEEHGGSQCIHVEADGDISTKSISTSLGAVVEIKNGKISGGFWFDPALGMIVDMNTDQDMKLNITTRAQTMTAQFSQNIHLAVVDVQ
jgi:uncharacterized protein DUF6263